MIGTADLHTAIETKWVASGLDDKFKAFWDSSIDDDNFTVLNDSEASPHQPFPYCIFSTNKPQTKTRMSSSSTGKLELRNVQLQFRIWSDKVKTDARSAKQIAAYLAEEVMKVFGGHPTVPSTDMELSNGGICQSQFGIDYGVRDDNLYKYCWTIEYNLLLDIPVAI
jgi:hypothetical protein